MSAGCIKDREVCLSEFVKIYERVLAGYIKNREAWLSEFVKIYERVLAGCIKDGEAWLSEFVYLTSEYGQTAAERLFKELYSPGWFTLCT